MSQNKRPRAEDPMAAAATPAAGFATVSGKADDPMTDRQAVELRALADKAGEPFDGNLTRGQAQKRIEYLREQVD